MQPTNEIKKFKEMKKNIFLVFMLLCMGSSFAQVSFNVSADLQSRYVWRGQALGGNAPCIEPGANISYKGLSFGVWGAYSLNSTEYQELDWSLSYSFLDEMFTIMVTDYSFPSYSSAFHYFNYDANTTNHVIEGGLVFKVPSTHLSLSLYTNLYGADARTIDDELVYSTYTELAYELECSKINTTFNFVAGCAINGKEDYSFYGNDGLGIVNLGITATHALEITPSFSLPIYAQVIANPVDNKMYFVGGAHIEL